MIACDDSAGQGKIGHQIIDGSAGGGYPKGFWRSTVVEHQEIDVLELVGAVWAASAGVHYLKNARGGIEREGVIGEGT